MATTVNPNFGADTLANLAATRAAAQDRVAAARAQVESAEATATSKLDAAKANAQQLVDDVKDRVADFKTQVESAIQQQQDAAQARAAGTKSAAAAPQDRLAKARAQSQDFEAVFLNSMFQHMFAGADGEGPLGNSTGVGAWRSMLTDEYAKFFAKSGGIGIANQVYRELIARQETSAK